MRIKIILIICVLAISAKRLKNDDKTIGDKGINYQKDKESNPYNLCEDEFSELFLKLKILINSKPRENISNRFQQLVNNEKIEANYLSEEGLKLIKSSLKRLSNYLIEFEKIQPFEEKPGVLEFPPDSLIDEFEAYFDKYNEISGITVPIVLKAIMKINNFSILSDELRKLFERITKYLGIKLLELRLLVGPDDIRREIFDIKRIKERLNMYNKLLKMKMVDFEEKLESNQNQIKKLQIMAENRLKSAQYWFKKLNKNHKLESNKIYRIIKQEIAKKNKKEEKNKEIKGAKQSQKSNSRVLLGKQLSH